MAKVIVYFTDSRLEEELDLAVRKQILKAANGIPIISVSQKPIDFGKNICVGIKPRSYLSLYSQLLTGIKAAEKDSIIFTCEHDVFYNPEYFEFTPPSKEKIYFNTYRYYWGVNKQFFLRAHGPRALSQGVGYRTPFLKYAREQVSKRKDGVMCLNKGPFDNFASKYPNVDIRHGGNFSKSWASDWIAARENSGDSKAIEYWEDVDSFQDATGYRNIEVGTREALHERFNPNGDINPVKTGLSRNDLAGLFSFFKFNKGAEVGVKLGKFSAHLCANMPELTLKCVDPYNPSIDVSWDKAEAFFNRAQKVLEPYNAQIIKKTSVHAATEDVPVWSLDFVYIDASHLFNDVMQDIILWTDRVRPGGIVSGHDYDNPDVKIAVDAYTMVHGYELFVTGKGKEYPDNSQSWFSAREEL
jgi:hypothetical protein